MNLESMTVAGYMAAMAGKAARDIVVERVRQVVKEGWLPEHDDQHAGGELAAAASCYALNAGAYRRMPPKAWPFDREWWKPGDERRDLVKAGALILAEIERLDRIERDAMVNGNSRRID